MVDLVDLSSAGCYIHVMVEMMTCNTAQLTS